MDHQLISFEGVGDALAVVHVDGVPFTYDAYGGAQFHLGSRTGGRLQVTLTVDDLSGCWSIGVGQTSEVHPAAEWPVTVEQAPGNDYSARLTVTVPADCSVVEI